MTGNKINSLDHSSDWRDPDDAPEARDADVALSVWRVGDVETNPATGRELMAQALRRGGRPKLDNPKRQITLRLDADLVEALKATGEGWQSRINATLRRAAGL